MVRIVVVIDIRQLHTTVFLSKNILCALFYKLILELIILKMLIKLEVIKPKNN